jgi:hypothetical protein
VYEVTEHRQHRAGQQDRDERTKRVAERGLHAERGEEIECRVHAEHHEIALGEIDDPHHPENQSEPDAHQAIDRTDQKSGGQCLQKTFQGLGHRRPRAGRAYRCFAPATDIAASAVCSLTIVLPVVFFSLSIMMPAAAAVRPARAGSRRQ